MSEKVGEDPNDDLNTKVWVKLAPSPIHGVGVVAIRDIPKGQRIYCRSGGNRTLNVAYDEPIDHLLPEIKALILGRWPHARTRGYPSPNNDQNLMSFMNHSTNPNYDKYNDVALKDIKKGEELTEDYGYDPLTQDLT